MNCICVRQDKSRSGDMGSHAPYQIIPSAFHERPPERCSHIATPDQHTHVLCRACKKYWSTHASPSHLYFYCDAALFAHVGHIIQKEESAPQSTPSTTPEEATPSTQKTAILDAEQCQRDLTIVRRLRV